MRATVACTSTTSTRCRTSSPTRRAWGGSIPSPAWSTTWNARPPDDALRLLAPGVRRLVAERPRRGDGSELGVRAPPGPAERGDWVRPDLDCGVESPRYHRTRSPPARCL